MNKQLSEEEYKNLLPKLIEHLEANGEWGEFLPASISPFSYNETVANEYYPLCKEEVLAKGFKWKDPNSISNFYQGPKIQIPDNIKETSEEIIQKILTCERCNKNYKIISQEFNFYKKNGIPIPHFCPDCRHKDRMALKNPRHLWDRSCMKCGAKIKTSYAPERPEIVYCEECYLKEVY